MRMTSGFSDPPRRFEPRPKTKRAVNLSVDAEILAEAKAMHLNLSQVLEDALRARTKDERIRRFQEEHREAFESYNRFIAEHGIWGRKYRKW